VWYLRRAYLKQYRYDLWRALAGNGILKAHLLEIDKTANEWMDKMLPQMMKAAGVTEELKARDQMAWVGLVNNCKARIEEIILEELVYK
ncbi:MAG: TnpV protein, partial [Oscillospiraceae bacterium]|nr:TnpV protein [Oscillospiraceae bacterium]